MHGSNFQFFSATLMCALPQNSQFYTSLIFCAVITKLLAKEGIYIWELERDSLQVCTPVR